MSVAAAPAAPAECAGHELVDPHELAFPESVALAVILQTLHDLQGSSTRPARGPPICARLESEEQCWGYDAAVVHGGITLTCLVFNTVQVYRRQGARRAPGHERHSSGCGIIAVK